MPTPPVAGRVSLRRSAFYFACSLLLVALGLGEIQRRVWDSVPVPLNGDLLAELSGQRYIVELVGQDGDWFVRYPDSTEFESSETSFRVALTDTLVLPSHSPVTLVLTSHDRACQFLVPEQGLKQIAVPGLRFEIDLPAADNATWHLLSQPDCGGPGPPVSKTLSIQSAESFARWWTQLPREQPTSSRAD
ncbi:MAG: hypothetical protein KDA83_17940 [Planctomycetales bacterium]|nr:hypothetical protein [Planctomycetales bacterium]